MLNVILNHQAFFVHLMKTLKTDDQEIDHFVNTIHLLLGEPDTTAERRL